MTPESAVLKAVLEYLAAKRIYALRMNTGAVLSEYKGRKRMTRFGVPGMADVLAFRTECEKIRGCDILELDPFMFDGAVTVRYIIPIWIECKAERGKQSPLQKSFQAQVEEQGHIYLLVRSVEDLIAAGL